MLGYRFIPVAVGTYGAWGKEAVTFIKQVAEIQARGSDGSRSTLANKLWHRLGVAVEGGGARLPWGPPSSAVNRRQRTCKGPGTR